MRPLVTLGGACNDALNLLSEDRRAGKAECEGPSKRFACAENEKLGRANSLVIRLDVDQPYSLDLRVHFRKQNCVCRHAKLEALDAGAKFKSRLLTGVVGWDAEVAKQDL